MITLSKLINVIGTYRFTAGSRNLYRNEPFEIHFVSFTPLILITLSKLINVIGTYKTLYNITDNEYSFKAFQRYAFNAFSLYYQLRISDSSFPMVHLNP